MDLGVRCINCKASAYCMLEQGIQVDQGWLCYDCLTLPFIKRTSWPE